MSEGVKHYRVWMNLWPHGTGGGAYVTELDAAKCGPGAEDRFEVIITSVDGKATVARTARELENKTVEAPQWKYEPPPVPRGQEPISPLCPTCHLAPHDDCIIPGCPGILRTNQFPASPVETEPYREMQEKAVLETAKTLSALQEGERVNREAREARRRYEDAMIEADTRKQVMREYARSLLKMLCVESDGILLAGADRDLARDIVREFCGADERERQEPKGAITGGVVGNGLPKWEK